MDDVNVFEVFDNLRKRVIETLTQMGIRQLPENTVESILKAVRKYAEGLYTEGDLYEAVYDAIYDKPLYGNKPSVVANALVVAVKQELDKYTRRLALSGKDALKKLILQVVKEAKERGEI